MHSDDLHQRADPDADAAGNARRAITPTLAVVGAGKVGSTLALLLAARGCRVTAVASRTRDHAEALAARVEAQAVGLSEAFDADLALITVPDDAITATAARLKGFSGKAAVHTSGAHDVSALAPLAERGIQVGSLHPAYPFADVESAVMGLPGATFAVEADSDPLRGWLSEIVTALDGRVLVVPDGGKATYHAALSIASNYTVALYALAERLLLGLGADKAAADAALDSLLGGTVANLRAQGIPLALTGALARGDVGTVVKHIEALRQIDGDAADLYIHLARMTLSLLAARGIAPDEIAHLLQQESDHANNGS